MIPRVPHPESWSEIALGEINQYRSKNVQPKDSPDEPFELWSVPIFPTGKPEVLLGSEIGSSKQAVKPRDVLICKINPRINRVWEVGQKASYRQIASSEWIVVRQPLMEPRYLLRLFQSDQFRTRLCADVTGVGGSLTRAQPKKVATFPIVVPPLAEQKAIADKLDTLLARVENTKARLERIPQILKRFRQSVLAAAVSGQLTEEWRDANNSLLDGHELNRRIKEAHAAAGGHARGNASKPTEEAHDLSSADLPATWSIAEMRDLCAPGKPITYGILKPGPELEEGVPYIRVADFPGNKLNMEKIKKTSYEIDLKYKRARLSEGDLLLSIRGSVGRLIKIPSVLEGANITQDTARLSISPSVSIDFVYWTLLAESTQRRMKNATRGVAVRGINIGDVRALQVPLPPLDEQVEVVRRVERLVAHADSIEQQVNNALARIDNLTQSILAKAFRGELTEQWRKDNPELISGENSAEALLERIEAERASHKTAGRRTKTKKSEASAT